MNSNSFTIIIVCVILAAGIAAAAQAENTGNIMGYVRDAAGKPLVQAQVLMVETGEIARTDTRGKFIFNGEDPQAYTLSASTAGYQAVIAKATVVAGRTANTDFTLRIRIPLAVHQVSVKNRTSTRYVVENSHPMPPPPDPFADSSLSSFSGDAGLHATARSR